MSHFGQTTYFGMLIFKRKILFQEFEGARDFNLPNHSISDFIVFGLSLVSGNNDCRKTKEMRLIHRLGTHNPNGMNEQFNYS